MSATVNLASSLKKKEKKTGQSKMLQPTQCNSCFYWNFYIYIHILFFFLFKFFIFTGLPGTSFVILILNSTYMLGGISYFPAPEKWTFGELHYSSFLAVSLNFPITSKFILVRNQLIYIYIYILLQIVFHPFFLKNIFLSAITHE